MSTVSGSHAALLQEFITGSGYTQLNCSFISKEDTQLCGVEDGSPLFHYILTEWSRKRQILGLTIPSLSPSRTFLTGEKSRGQSQAGENLGLRTVPGRTETSVYWSKVVSSCLHCGRSGVPDHVCGRRQWPGGMGLLFSCALSWPEDQELWLTVVLRQWAGGFLLAGCSTTRPPWKMPGVCPKDIVG